TITQGSGTDLRSLAYTYGADGFVSRITDAQNRETLYQRDLAGRITQATLPGTRVIGTGYDANGNVAGVTPPNKPTHTFGYTAVDLAEQYTPPTLAGLPTPQTQYAWNRDKNLTQLTRPDGVTLAYGYDAGGRLGTITPSGNGDVITYGYHATTGQLISLQNLPSPLAGEGPGVPQTLTYTWDGFLPTSETFGGQISGTLSRTYDNNFRTTQLGVNGDAIALGYDNDDLLTSSGAITFTRNAQNGLLTGTTLGSTTTTHTYNAFGELATFTANHGTDTLLADSYTYDTLGRITTKTATLAGVTDIFAYSYDLAGRLESVTKNGVTVENYGYDANGNRLSSNGIAGTYDDQDRLLTYNGNTYTYTANGEWQTKTNAAGVTNYTYDVYGNLKTAHICPESPLSPCERGAGGEGATTRIDYLTDARNRRIGKQVNGVLVQGFLYQDQLRIAAELDAANTVVSRFVYGTRINVP
ncbi:MAG: RHS repeat protein, partial [Nitrospirota bacterium]